MCSDLEAEIHDRVCDSSISMCRSFRIFYDNYTEISKLDDIKILLPLLDFIVEQVTDIGNYDELFQEMQDLLDDDKIAKNISLKIIHQLLHSSIAKIDYTLNLNRLANQLTAVLLENQNIPEDEHLNSQILSCLKLCSNVYTTQFVEDLWAYCQQVGSDKQNLSLRIIVQFYDEFVHEEYDMSLKSAYWTAIIQKLLTSNEAKDRKIAQFLIQKQLEQKNIEQYEYWCIYYNILVSLETNQSHLILPALKSLKLSIELLTQELKPWQDILYIRILQQQNSLVLRASIEHMLDTYKCDNIDATVLQYLLAALNKTAHFNPEAYCFPDTQLVKFMSTQSHKSWLEFLKVFCNINWSSVPLYCLLKAFPEEHNFSKDLHYTEEFLKLAACVRRLQHMPLREKCCLILCKKFEKMISQLLLHEYVVFIEALYNLSDNICNNLWHIFVEKLLIWQKANFLPAVNFTERFYKILAKCEDYAYKLCDVFACFKQLDVAWHGWMRYFFLYDLKRKIPLNEVENYCSQLYAVNLKEIQNLPTVQAIYEAFLTENCSAQEKTYIFEQSVECFTENCLQNVEHFRENMTNIELLLYLIENATYRTLKKLVELLKFLENGCVVFERNKLKLAECLIKRLKQIDFGKLFMRADLQVIECCLQLDKSSSLEFVLELVKTSEKCYQILQLDIEFEATQYVELILYDEIISGDARIESMYCKKTHGFRCCIANILKTKSQQLIQEVVDKLLQRNLELFTKKPRYFLDSREHRQQLIIANSIWMLLYSHEDLNRYADNFYQILHKQNNQINVTIFYELLAARSLKNIHELLTKFNEYEVIKSSASVQISMLSVLHMFCERHHLSTTELEEVCFKLLLSFTMAAYFQVRSFSILILQELLKSETCTSSSLTSLKVTIDNIVHVQNLNKNNVLRLVGTSFHMYTGLNICFDEVLLYLTNAPRDLYDCDKCSKIQELKELHDRFKTKEPRIEENHDIEMPVCMNIQRKMQINDIFPEDNTLSCITKAQDVEMFVVASLIDKLPNLGGIARTCEVMGIRNLVLQNKLVIEKIDFKSLSMTAEKSLNIMEVKKEDLPTFLTEKLNTGFKIIGAEQTAESVNFVDFIFPKKCVLLLGHEKEGISPTLLPYLSCAVEIPQFGKVRSLNVHVTASIFMWEFCKQHIIKAAGNPLITKI